MFVRSTYLAKVASVEDGDPVPLLSKLIAHSVMSVIQVLSLTKFIMELHLAEWRWY